MVNCGLYIGIRITNNEPHELFVSAWLILRLAGLS